MRMTCNLCNVLHAEGQRSVWFLVPFFSPSHSASCNAIFERRRESRSLPMHRSVESGASCCWWINKTKGYYGASQQKDLQEMPPHFDHIFHHWYLHQLVHQITVRWRTGNVLLYCTVLFSGFHSYIHCRLKGVLMNSSSHLKNCWTALLYCSKTTPSFWSISAIMYFSTQKIMR